MVKHLFEQQLHWHFFHKTCSLLSFSFESISTPVHLSGSDSEKVLCMLLSKYNLTYTIGWDVFEMCVVSSTCMPNLPHWLICPNSYLLKSPAVCACLLMVLADKGVHFSLTPSFSSCIIFNHFYHSRKIECFLNGLWLFVSCY